MREQVGQGAQEHDREPRRHAHRASRLGRAEDHRRRGARDPRQGVRHERQREGLQDAPRVHPRHPGRWHLVRDAERDPREYGGESVGGGQCHLRLRRRPPTEAQPRHAEVRVQVLGGDQEGRRDDARVQGPDH